jgi:hypothetical protein
VFAFNLNDRVRDKQTGAVGVVKGRAEFDWLQPPYMVWFGNGPAFRPAPTKVAWYFEDEIEVAS